MAEWNTPESRVGIRERLAALRSRKAILDAAIASLEQYATLSTTYSVPSPHALRPVLVRTSTDRKAVQS